jgi:hypothetical protein
VIESGDVLAAAPSLQFEAFIDLDPLKRISSILNIRRSGVEEEGPMSLRLDGHRIDATLSQRDYDRYTALKADPSVGPLLANQVIVPAILEALYYIKATSEEDFEMEMDRRWFRSVYRKLEEAGMNLRESTSDPLLALQVLLRLPLRRSLEGMIQLNPLEETE